MSAQLPASWALAPLGQIADVQLGKMLSAKARGGHRARPYLRNINVRWHHIDASDVLEMDFDAREAEKYRLMAGDVLVCEGGEPARAAVWKEQLPGALYQKALHRVRFRDGVLDPALLVYQLELAAANGSIARSFTGSTIKHLPREAFIAWRVALPPLAEQRRIVAALEEHLSDLDAAVAGLQRAKVRLARLRESTLSAAFRDATWPQARLGSLVESGPDNGLYLPKTAYGSGTPILRIDDYQNFWSRVSSELRRVRTDDATTARYELRVGDLVVNRVNSPSHLGKCLVVEQHHVPALFESNMMRMHLSEGIEPDFVALFLRSPEGRARLTLNAKWAVNQASINQGDVCETLVPLPTSDVQREVASTVLAQLSTADRTAAEIGVQLGRAGRLRQSILKRAFEGKLVPQDPSDEPASALLARTRETSTASAATPRTRGARSRPTARSGRA